MEKFYKQYFLLIYETKYEFKIQYPGDVLGGDDLLSCLPVDEEQSKQVSRTAIQKLIRGGGILCQLHEGLQPDKRNSLS